MVYEDETASIDLSGRLSISTDKKNNALNIINHYFCFFGKNFEKNSIVDFR